MSLPSGTREESVTYLEGLITAEPDANKRIIIAKCIDMVLWDVEYREKVDNLLSEFAI